MALKQAQRVWHGQCIGALLMSYSWFVFGREAPSFKSRFSTAKFRVGAWPGTEDGRDWEDLTSQLDFTPRFWAEVPLLHGGVPSEIWNAHELLARRIADAMHGVALTEDGAVLHRAKSLRTMEQVAFDGWLLDVMASATRAAELRGATKRSHPQMSA